MEKLIVIGGPTSSGKTDLAVNISKQFNGELINADSRQIYKYLDIGTNKSSTSTHLLEGRGDRFAVGEVPIHLINFLNPDQRFSVFEFKKLAEETIKDIISRGKLPILVGGTGLYIDAIIHNYKLREGGNYESSNRDYLETLSVEELQNNLSAASSQLLNDLNESDKNNPRRLIRAIEKSKSQTSNLQHVTSNYETLFLYPEYNWEDLKMRIEARVDEMFKEGLIKETRKVLKMGFSKDSIALQGIGYKQVIEYLDGKYDLGKCIDLVKTAHKQYARRQRTWFEGKGRGYELNKISNSEQASKLISKFLS